VAAVLVLEVRAALEARAALEVQAVLEARAEVASLDARVRVLSVAALAA